MFFAIFHPLKLYVLFLPYTIFNPLSILFFLFHISLVDLFLTTVKLSHPRSHLSHFSRFFHHFSFLPFPYPFHFLQLFLPVTTVYNVCNWLSVFLKIRLYRPQQSPQVPTWLRSMTLSSQLESVKRPCHLNTSERRLQVDMTHVVSITQSLLTLRWTTKKLIYLPSWRRLTNK